MGEVYFGDGDGDGEGEEVIGGVSGCENTGAALSHGLEPLLLYWELCFGIERETEKNITEQEMADVQNKISKM